MSTATSNATGFYLYSIARSADAAAIESAGIQGLNKDAISAQVFGPVAAITTNIVPEKIRPRRQHLAAHQNVVKELCSQWDALPVSFGVIADNHDELEQILTNSSDSILERLDATGGRVEMSLTLSWASENVFQYFVEQNEELKAARDALAAGANREQMLEIGQFFESLREQERSKHASIAQQGLSHVCDQIEIQDPKSENEVVRLNCLISQDGEPAFTDALNAVAQNYNEDYAFSFSGPWPPYNFVQLSLTKD